MTRLPVLSSLLLTIPVSLLGACDDATPGVRGNVDFVVDDCGQDACALDDLLAVGASLDLHLRGVDGVSVDGLEFRTATNAIAQVISQRDDAGVPYATVHGVSPGAVDLLAIDREGSVVDKVTLQYVAVRELEVTVAGDRVDGPHEARDHDDLYYVDADSDVEIEVRMLGELDGRDGDYLPLAGYLSYLVEVDTELASRLAPGDAVDDGRFRFAAPSGSHVVVIRAGDEARSLVFESR